MRWIRLEINQGNTYATVWAPDIIDELETSGIADKRLFEAIMAMRVLPDTDIVGISSKAKIRQVQTTYHEN